jgi:hypothetical protein
MRGTTGKVLLGLAAAGNVQVNAASVASPNVDRLASNALFGESNRHSIDLKVDVLAFTITLRPAVAAAA